MLHSAGGLRDMFQPSPFKPELSLAEEGGHSYATPQSPMKVGEKIL